MTGILQTLLWVSIRSSVLIVIIMLLRLLFRRMPKWTRLLLWGIAALSLLLPVRIESTLSPMPKNAAERVDEVFEGATDAVEDTEIRAEINTPGETSQASESGKQTEAIAAGSAGGSASVTEDVRLSQQIAGNLKEKKVQTTLVFLWLAGMAAMLLYAFGSYLKLRHSIAASVEEDGLFLCDDIQVPFILGVIRPRIFLPSWIGGEERALVLAHERAHLTALHHVWKLIGFLILSIYWFHPLVWAAWFMFVRDLEMACDEKVIRELALDANGRADYSETLLAFSSGRHRLTPCPLAFGENDVKSRVKEVLSYRKAPFWIILAVLILGAAAAVILLTVPPKGADAPGNDLEPASEEVLPYAEILGEEVGKYLAPYIQTEKVEFQGDYEGIRVESVLSDNHTVLMVLSEDRVRAGSFGLMGTRIASEQADFLITSDYQLSYGEGSDRVYRMLIASCTGRADSAWVILPAGTGTVNPDSRLEVKLSPMPTLHSDGDESFGNIELSMLSVWTEDLTQKAEGNTIQSVWPAHDFIIRMKGGKTLGGTREELEAGTGAAAALGWGTEMTYQNSAYLCALFTEPVDLDQVKAVEIDGKEFRLSKQEASAAETAPSEDPDGFWQDGLVLQCENELTMMLLQDENSGTEMPCTLGNLTEADEEALGKLETGRKISIRTDMIMESYPAQAQVKELRISEDETLQDVDPEIISQLRSMGYLIILPGETSGLPDFEFSLVWGPYGVSSYDSASGELVMNKEENHPENYTAIHQLTDEERRKVWELLISLPYDAYPEDYIPNPNGGTEPEIQIVLNVTVDGKTHTTKTTYGALLMNDSVEAGVQNGAKAFAKVIRELENLLMETPEWQAFPAPEVYYE